MRRRCWARPLEVSCGGFELIDPIAPGAWEQLSGWKTLYGTEANELALARAHLANAVQRLPKMLKDLG